VVISSPQTLFLSVGNFPQINGKLPDRSWTDIMKNSSQTYSHSGVNKGILFVLICVNYLFILIPRLALAINADQIMDFFKIDPIGLGILASIYFYPYSLMQIPAGLFADLIKPEVLIVVSLFAGSMGNLLFILAPRFLLAIASRFIAGLTSSLIYIPSLRLLAAKYPPEKFGQVSGTLLAMSSLAMV
jgi:sugar phosphate permease